LGFGFSKVLAILLQPSHLALAALVIGLLQLGRNDSERRGRRLAWGGLLYLFAAGFSPLGNWLILPLEQTFITAPQPKPDDRIRGIIMLGGFEDGWVTSGRKSLTLTDSGERLTESLRLARLLPEAKVVFTGGSGALWKWGEEASGAVGAYLTEAGVAPSRIILEGQSRNTEENARFSAELLKPTPDQTWVLVTSAYHMPRAVGLFRRAGFQVVPYPVDYRTRDWGDARRFFDRFADGHKRMDYAFNEWLGLIVYRLTGRIDAILPTT
jgi:uncharacterized SAM-binding protein YcdF (DUF218 family)